MLDSKTIKIVTPLQKHKYQMMEDGANFNIRRTKYGAVWMHVCEQKMERHISRLIYETFVAQCISFQVDDWRGNVIFPISIVYISKKENVFL